MRVWIRKPNDVLINLNPSISMINKVLEEQSIPFDVIKGFLNRNSIDTVLSAWIGSKNIHLGIKKRKHRITKPTIVLTGVISKQIEHFIWVSQKLNLKPYQLKTKYLSSKWNKTIEFVCRYFYECSNNNNINNNNNNVINGDVNNNNNEQAYLRAIK